MELKSKTNRKTTRPEFPPKELRKIVKGSGALWGQISARELGEDEFQRIERLRLEMTKLRACGYERKVRSIEKWLSELRVLDRPRRLGMARAFTLLLA